MQLVKLVETAKLIKGRNSLMEMNSGNLEKTIENYRDSVNERLKTANLADYKLVMSPDGQVQSGTEAAQFITNVNQMYNEMGIGKNRYVLWTLDTYVSGGIAQPEDIRDVAEDLVKFERLNQSTKWRENGLSPNIIDFKDALSLRKAVQSVEVEQDAKFELVDKGREFFNTGDAKMWVENTRVYILSPMTAEASTHFADGTNWCTRHADTFTSYNRDHDFSKHPLFILVDRQTKERFQLFFAPTSSEEYMDEDNESINQPGTEKNLFNFFKKYSDFLKIPYIAQRVEFMTEEDGTEVLRITQ